MFNPAKIEEILSEKGISKTQFYKETSVSKSNMFVWSNGTSLPGADKLEEMADYFMVPIDYFFERKVGQIFSTNGHHVTGNGNTVNGDITLNEYRTENAHLKQLLEEKERTIQILMKKNNL